MGAEGGASFCMGSEVLIAGKPEIIIFLIFGLVMA